MNNNKLVTNLNANYLNGISSDDILVRRSNRLTGNVDLNGVLTTGIYDADFSPYPNGMPTINGQTQYQWGTYLVFRCLSFCVHMYFPDRSTTNGITVQYMPSFRCYYSGKWSNWQLL